MNKIKDVNEFCRSRYEKIDTVDLGTNKISTIPNAMFHFMKSLCSINLINNDIQKLPAIIGVHKALKNITVDGNPLKSIRRPIVDGGSGRLMSHLGDKYNDTVDSIVEEWAIQ
jgi:Leucine-rich repeat (LRR) protein